LLIVVYFFSYSINVTNETFSIISSSNADSLLFHENGGDSSQSSVPNSESGTTLLSHEDIVCYSNCPSSVSITDASPGDVTTSTSSIVNNEYQRRMEGLIYGNTLMYLLEVSTRIMHSVQSVSPKSITP
jgi:hypothetical protein